MGIPLAILNHVKGNEDILVLEMGMTNAGQIAKLVDIAPPDVAVITATALVHVINFEGLEDIGRAKNRNSYSSQNTTRTVNYDIKNFSELYKVGNCRKLSFSVSSSKADYYLKSARDKIKIKSPEGTGEIYSGQARYSREA